MRPLQYISSGTCLAASATWELALALPRYKDGPRAEAFAVASAFGRCVHAQLKQSGLPSVVCIFKPFIEGFAAGYCAAAAAYHSPPTSFVLVCVNGGDKPLNHAQQSMLAALPGLRASYSTNLLAPSAPWLFKPLPVGLCGNSTPEGFDALVARVRQAAPPWEERDPRLLVGPMRVAGRGKLRDSFLCLLKRPEFASHVRVVSHEDGRLAMGDFLSLLAAHRAVLSPPGSGYDCLRTWQAVAVGSVPLIVRDDAFDARLFDGTGAVALPRPEQLTAEALGLLLETIQRPPAGCADLLTMSHWKRVWAEELRAGHEN